MATKQVTAALPGWPETEEQRHQATLEALAEVDAGRLIPHAEVRVWIESLDTDQPLPPAYGVTLDWTPGATADLMRVRSFLAARSPPAASRVTNMLVTAPERLRDFPRTGRRLSAYAPREVRRLIVGNYEVRYEIEGDNIRVLRLWHHREHRAAGET